MRKSRNDQNFGGKEKKKRRETQQKKLTYFGADVGNKASEREKGIHGKKKPHRAVERGG